MTTNQAITVGEYVFDVDISGPVDAETIVLLHGFPESKEAWGPLTDSLIEAGFRVVAPNQRGYSPGARPTDVAAYEIEHLTADIIGLLDALDLPSAHLVGHDWGAIVAWFVAGRHPERVRTLTAVSIPHPAAFGWALVNDPDQKERSGYFTLFRQVGKAEDVLLADDARRLRTMFGATIDASYVEPHVRLLTEPGALTAALSWYRAMTKDFANLGSIEVPTTYVWSTGDLAVSSAAAAKCGEYVSGPYEVVQLDGVSHWIPEEGTGRLSEAVLNRAR
ncbi:alpha/beta fold hydrolase [Antrihabitans cavernicola]|uniref:Alpha/beta hydrolase n=1 Tax=Antrihabitans cavernicola TaxID=2495913 RepID=A0A5A7SCR9_9NOCA|nr:alpha/beta hydrolase [Spelaeibacter cavernicola]KAA0023950.1 alpha/beta hydrolase [Spelaeibacter cavernicola]